ncbi:unnamed protein product, partial [Symbiodinium sp. CCMP2456]
VWTGPKDIWFLYPEQQQGVLHQRVLDDGMVQLSSAQQTNRFDARSKRLVETLNMAALPEYKAAPPPLAAIESPAVSGGKSMVDPSPSESAAPAAEADVQHGPNSDDEAKEAELLDLTVRPQKKLKTGKEAKVKKSKEDILQAELEKVQQTVMGLKEALTSFPDMPPKFGYDVGKVDRSLAALVKQSKEANSYDKQTDFTKLVIEVAAVRDCVKAATKYLPAGGLPVKKHSEPFMTAFEEATEKCPQVLTFFPASVRVQFAELGLVKQLKQKKWDEIGLLLSSKRQLELAEGDNNLAERKSTNMMERILHVIFEEASTLGYQADSQVGHKDFVRDIFVEACATILDEGPVASLVQSLESLQAIVSKDTGGASTLDVVLDFVQSKTEEPVVRVFASSQIGRQLLQDAMQFNASLQSAASAASTLNALMKEIEDASAEEDWAAFLQDPSEERLEQLCEQNFANTLNNLCERLLRVARLDGMILATNELANLESDSWGLCSSKSVHFLETTSVLAMEFESLVMQTDGAVQVKPCPPGQAKLICQYVDMLSKFHALLQKTDAEGKSLTTWRSSCAEFVAKARGQSARELAVALQVFSASFQSISSMSHSSATKRAVSVEFDAVLLYFKSLMESLLPEIFESIICNFEASCLEKQDWWKRACGMLFLPEPGATTFESIDRAAVFELPAQQLSCLQGMHEALQSIQVQVDETKLANCKRLYARSLILHGATNFISMTRVHENPNEARLLEITQAIEGSLRDGVVKGFASLASCGTAAEIADISTCVTNFVSEMLAKTLLTYLCKHLAQAVKLIPENLDNWLVARNTSMIKNQVLKRETHQAILGSFEQLTKVHELLDGLIVDMATMVPAHMLSKLKSATRDVK